MSTDLSSTETKKTLSFSKKSNLLDTVMENNRKYLEEKKQKYGFDFASDTSTPSLIFIEPFVEKKEIENSKTPEEKNSWDHICFYDKKSLKKALKERLKNSFCFQKNPEIVLE